jgi:hypothetical protein
VYHLTQGCNPLYAKSDIRPLITCQPVKNGGRAQVTIGYAWLRLTIARIKIRRKHLLAKLPFDVADERRTWPRSHAELIGDAMGIAHVFAPSFDDLALVIRQRRFVGPIANSLKP